MKDVMFMKDKIRVKQLKKQQNNLQNSGVSHDSKHDSDILMTTSTDMDGGGIMEFLEEEMGEELIELGKSMGRSKSKKMINNVKKSNVSLVSSKSGSQ